MIWWWFSCSFWSPHNILTVVLAKNQFTDHQIYWVITNLFRLIIRSKKKNQCISPFFWKVPIPKVPGLFPPRCSGSPARVFLREQQATNERGTDLYSLPTVECEYQPISCFQNRLESNNEFQNMGAIISLRETYNFSCCLISVVLHSHLNVVSDMVWAIIRYACQYGIWHT